MPSAMGCAWPPVNRAHRDSVGDVVLEGRGVERPQLN